MSFCFQANAQTIGIKGGLSLANQRHITYQDDDDTEQNHYSMNPGFHVGLTFDVHFNDFLSLEPGIILIQKGFKQDGESYDVSYSAKANLYYLDVPLNFKVSYSIAKGVKLFGGIGPYIGFGLSGNMLVIGESGTEKESVKTKIKWGNDEVNNHFKRLDWGITFVGGVEISSILIGISYDLGLYNVSPYQKLGNCRNNRILNISVGYRF
jgi:hypothetical protein